MSTGGIVLEDDDDAYEDDDGAPPSSISGGYAAAVSSGLFYRTEPDGSRSPTAALFLLTASVPIALGTGRWSWGLAAFAAAVLLASCNAAQQIRETDKQEIRYDVLDAESVLREMIEWEEELLPKHNHRDKENGKTVEDMRKGNVGDNDIDDGGVQRQQLLLQQQQRQRQVEQARLVIRVGLNALAKKYGKVLARRSSTRSAADHENGKNRKIPSPSIDDSNDRQPDLPLWCQRAAYVGLRCFPNDDAVVASSISLLALSAKDHRVQERHLYQADQYGLDVPIGAMDRALVRAKKVGGSGGLGGSQDRKREQRSAELQRKGCLLLGALASSSTSAPAQMNGGGDETIANQMAAQVVREGGLEAILRAVNWYRYHSDVANWALWAAFTLCYENYEDKCALVRANGVLVVLQTMRNCPDSVEVARHGTAILFDLMREDDEVASTRPREATMDVWKIRSSALEAGMHGILAKAMEQFPGEMDIMMMGQEILIGTGYEGDIPQFDPLNSRA